MTKQTERTIVALTLENVLAGRIWTQFCNNRGQRVLAEKFNSAIQDARGKHKQAPDDALIPVSVTLTLKEAETILVEFAPWIGAPHDRRVYQAVSDAMKASENQ